MPPANLPADLSLLRTALEWHRAGHGVAVASVVSTWGSAPCPAGSQLVIRADTRFEGSVSGGCVETAVISSAVDLLARDDPKPVLLSFGVSDEDAFEVGLACGGAIDVLLQVVTVGGDGLTTALLEELLRAGTERQPYVLACHLNAARCQLLHPSVAFGAADSPCTTLQEHVDRAARDDRSARTDDHFLRVFNPPLRLLIVGAVHIAQHLAAMAYRCHYEVTVIDPREAFLHSRFEGVASSSQWPDAALRAHAPDARTAVVTLTHDAKLDDPALEVALASNAFYIGALGSRRTQGKRRTRLLALGHDEATIDRISGPVGLDLG
ncbi:MAG: XdhC family protein, partial [Pseudomonadota bacterium]